MAEVGQSAGHPVHHHGHHWASAEAEFEGAKQGMWLFLVTEVLMLGGLFVAYAMFHGMYPEMFKAAHTLLDVKMGTTNTIILITSSVTMMLSVISVQRGRNDRAILGLIATLVLACGFLVVKYFEYSHKFHLGVFPGGYFNPNSPEIQEMLAAHPKLPLFFSLYFVMTGIHGLHVLIGMGLIAWVLVKTMRNRFSPNYYTPVEMVGFYWHFVDLVWIYLFPLLYLVS